MADPENEDHSEEMEQESANLGSHIDDARKLLADRKEAAGVVDDVAGEPSGDQDASGGEDPSGATDDVAPADDGADDGDDDERVPEEVASPT